MSEIAGEQDAMQTEQDLTLRAKLGGLEAFGKTFDQVRGASDQR